MFGDVNVLPKILIFCSLADRKKYMEGFRGYLGNSLEANLFFISSSRDISFLVERYFQAIIIDRNSLFPIDHSELVFKIRNELIDCGQMFVICLSKKREKEYEYEKEYELTSNMVHFGFRVLFPGEHVYKTIFDSIRAAN